MIIDRRKRLAYFLVLILIIILLLMLLFWQLFYRSKPEEVVVVEEPVITQTTVPFETEVSAIADQQRTGRIESASINVLAKTFVERYGSFSNEANFENLRDVLPLMTASFANETQEFIDSSSAPTDYYGMTSRVITVDVLEMDETAGIASLELTTQREEALDSPVNTTVRYQKIRLDFVMEDGVWKVASATWL